MPDGFTRVGGRMVPAANAAGGQVRQPPPAGPGEITSGLPGNITPIPPTQNTIPLPVVPTPPTTMPTFVATGPRQGQDAAVAVDYLMVNKMIWAQPGSITNIGGGNIGNFAQGPITTVPGDAVVWNSANGTMLADAGWPPAPLVSPAFTGTPTAPTQLLGTSGNQLATCAFVINELQSGAYAVQSFNGRVGAVTLTAPDVSGAGGLLTSGGTMTGPLTLNADPTTLLGAATKQYVDTHGAVTVSASPPTPITQGELWWDDVGLQLYVGYNDGTSTQFVVANNLSGVLQAPAGGPYLPTAGGTMTGPLNYTATGGTVSRSAQARAADVANVLDFGAVSNNTGVDSTPAFIAALATGLDVYAPMGTYSIRNQLVIGPGQALYGDGRAATTLYITSNFSASAASIISLSGLEQQSPTVRDITIFFQQPQDQTSRANFKTLAAGGTSANGGTGVMYPPAILTNNSNRFRLLNLSIWGAWDGIINPPSHNIGGFILDNIEIGALDVGLNLDNVLDFGHIKNYHFWPFALNGSGILQVFEDGNTFAAKFGATGVCNGINIVDFSLSSGRVSVANNGTWLHFANPMFDGGNSRLEIASCSWVMLSNAYFTGGPTPAISNSQIVMGGGNLFITNMIANTSTGLPVITHTGGRLMISNSLIGQGTNSVPAIQQTGGFLELTGNTFSASVTAAWTVPFINVGSSATCCSLHDNRMDAASPGDVGLVVLATDIALHSIRGNFWNGWKWTPPGNLGDYGLNSDGVTQKTITALSFATGSPSYTSATGISLQSSGQRTLNFSTNNQLQWALGAASSAGGGGLNANDVALLRYNSSGVQQANPLTVRWANGTIFTNQNPIIASWNVAPENLPSQYTWRAFGMVGYEGAGPGLEGYSNSNANSTAYIRLGRSRGTATAPTAVQNGDLLGDVMMGGYDGTAWQGRGALIRAMAAANWVNGSAYDTNILFYVTAGTTLSNVATITGTGFNNTVIGATTPAAGTFTQVNVTTAAGPNIRSGAGAAIGTQPSGSLWLRTDGAAGARLYVSQGAGTWTAVAGV